jgi:hypothetical protein
MQIKLPVVTDVQQGRDVKQQILDTVRISRKLDASRMATPLMEDMTHASMIIN